jgi:hypothetical protein
MIFVSSANLEYALCAVPGAVINGDRRRGRRHERIMAGLLLPSKRHPAPEAR